jgi:hypothetical protein
VGRVIPFQFDATVDVAGPIFGEFVVFLDALYEVLSVFVTDVLYAEIIDD